MATAKKTQIVITANAAVAKKVMDELQQRIDGIKQKMASLDVTTKEGQREFKKLEKELVSYNSAVSQNITNTERINKAMKNLSGTSLNELKRALSAAKSELGKMSSSSKGLKEMQGNVKALQGKIDKLTGSVHRQGGAWNTALKNLTAYVGLFAVFNQVKSMMTGVIKKNLEYSGSLTDIRKVAGLAQEDINELSNKLAKIDTRTSAEGLAKLAYEGAKLGMSKYGIDGMNSFVKAADQINVAIGEEMGEEALPALSKMVEVMGLIPRMGIEKAMLATGSAMFKLSTTSTSTSNDIVEFSKRLTGVARTAGITTDQLLALGSASSSMMLMPEVASTAMGKFIVALQKNHNLIAKELGIPDETIKNLYASGHAMDAIVLVLEKMRDKGNMNALGGIFKDLGSDGQRLVTAMVTMSKNVDMLKEHLDTSNDAFHEATAVTAEYEMQQESAIGILERANNLWEKAFVNPDGVDNIKELSKAWYDMSKFLTENVVALNSMKAVLWLVIVSCKTLIYILPALMAGLLFKGVSSAIFGIRTALVGVRESAFFATIRTEGLRAAWGRLNLTMKANWISLLIGLLVELGVALADVFSRQKDVAEGQLDINKYVREGAAEYDRERRKIDSYIAALNNANTSAKQRERIIKNFNREYKPYLDKLGLEVNSVDSLKKAYSQLNAELRKKMFYQIKQKAYDAELGKAEGDVGKAVMDYSKYINSDKGSTWAAYDTKYIQDQVDKGLDAKQIYRSMIESVYGKGGFLSDYDHSYVFPDGRSAKDELLYIYIKNIVNSQRGYNKTKKTIDDALDGLIGDYDPYAVESPGTLENDAPDKDAIRQEKQEKRERERAWREELKQKQDEANAIMDNVRNFYERQINAKMEEAIGLGMDETEQALYVEPVKRRMNEALEQVRLAIAGQANTWEQFKLTMKDDLIEQTDETGVNLSDGLLNAITANNIDALREKLSQLGESLNRPLNSILAEVFAKATKNAQANLALQLKQQEARRKAIQEHDYTGTVQQNMYDTFNTMGYANPNSVEIADKKAFDKRKANIIAMYEKARKEIASLYNVDASTKEGQGALLQLLFGDDPDGMGKRIAETLGKDAKEWQAFYQKLIQYSDEYTNAEKKNADERKKVNDFLWNRQGFQADQDNRRHDVQQVGSGVERFRKAGKGEDSVAPRSGEMGGSKFMDEFSYNTNLEQSKLEIILIQEKIAWLQKYNATSEQIAELQKSLAEKQDSYILSLVQTMKQRAEAVYALYKPLEDFGIAAGQAFATMTEDAEAGRDAFKAAIGDMINAMMKQTVQMTQEYIKRRLMQKINDKLVSTQIKKSTKEQVSLEQGGADATSAITKAAGDAKVMLTEQVGDQIVSAVTAQTQETTATSQAAAVDDVTTQAAKTEANVGLGIAEGSAKTIGSLGWWGIPLIAVITAVLNGLLGFAMGKVSSLFGKGKESNTSTKNTKVVSGMLTYDSGNVQDLKPFVGNDGSLYWATEDSKPHDGVSLLTQPTATTINGQPSLVAENGPELVIGRETTQAMMMNNPQLLKALVNYDRNYSGRRAYDTGNIAETSPAIAPGMSVSEESAVTQANTSTALLQAVNTLLQRLEQPIEAKIDMYGRGKLYDSMTKANQFMKNK